MKPIPVAALALLAVVVSCSDAVGPTRKTRELDVARQRWHAQDLHTYAFTVQRSCFCGNVHPLFVIVVSDTVAGVFDLEDGFKQVDSHLGETIEELFTFIQQAIDKPAEKIDVVYDPTRGFPVQVDYDGSAQIADDEIFYRVSDVHPISVPN